MDKKPVCELPVMKACCKSCPFKETQKRGWQNAGLANEVIRKNLFNSQQICHGTEGAKRKANNRCFGYYKYALEIYKRLGLDHLLK